MSYDYEKMRAELFTALLYRHWNHWRHGKVSHVWSLNPRGRRLTDLTPGPDDVPPFSLGGPDGFAVSLDGQEVCFSRKEEKGAAWSTNADVWVVPSAGGQPRRVADGPGEIGREDLAEQVPPFPVQIPEAVHGDDLPVDDRGDVLGELDGLTGLLGAGEAGEEQQDDEAVTSHIERLRPDCHGSIQFRHRLPAHPAAGGVAAELLRQQEELRRARAISRTTASARVRAARSGGGGSRLGSTRN